MPTTTPIFKGFVKEVVQIDFCGLLADLADHGDALWERPIADPDMIEIGCDLLSLGGRLIGAMLDIAIRRDQTREEIDWLLSTAVELPINRTLLDKGIDKDTRRLVSYLWGKLRERLETVHMTASAAVPYGIEGADVASDASAAALTAWNALPEAFHAPTTKPNIAAVVRWAVDELPPLRDVVIDAEKAAATFCELNSSRASAAHLRFSSNELRTAIRHVSRVLVRTAQTITHDDARRLRTVEDELAAQEKLEAIQRSRRPIAPGTYI